MISIQSKKISSRTIDKILHVDSLYAVFLFILINGSLNDVLLISTNAISATFLERVPNFILLSGCKEDNIFVRFFSRYYYNLPRFKIIKSILHPYMDCKLYGHDHIPFSSFFINKKICLIEDGLSNYVPRVSLKNIVKSWLGIEAFGRSNRVEMIYLTGQCDIPGYLRFKVEVIPFARDKRRLEYARTIFFTDFCFDEKCNYNILLTQPLSEDGVMGEDEKINLYKGIVSEAIKCDPSAKLIIKTHPRERTDYGSIYYGDDSVVVFSDPVPVEVVGFSIVLNKVITIFSTGAITLRSIQPDINVIFLGTKYHDKIYRRFGDVKV